MDKNIYKFIFYLLFFASYESRGQVMFNDGFEDQQFGSWENSSQWDITSLTPIAGNYSLHHNLTGVRSSSFISRKIPTKGFNDGIITWHLKLKNGNWIFGATEQFCFYLVSDRAEIPAANGYAIGINLAGGDNRMTLCRMSGGISVEVIVQTDLKWEPGMSLEIEVIHEYGSWKIRNKVEAATVWSEEKIGDEKLLDFYFSDIGILYKYNTSHGGQIWIDDVSMSYINRSPSVHKIYSQGKNEIVILFSEAMDPVSLFQTENYKIKTSSGSAVDVLSMKKIAGDSSGVVLKLGNINQRDMHLTLNHLIDLEGSILSVVDFDFSFVPAIQFGDVVFNEIMVDPNPVVKLPDAEFIELKNTSGFPFNTSTWKLEINGRTKTLSGKTIEPGGYLILGGTKGDSIWNNFGPNLEVAGLSLTNTGVVLKLYSATSEVIDSMSYLSSMLSNEHNDGGYSLERIDPLRSCGAASNWETSLSDNGGTPGIQNSVFRNNRDSIPPMIGALTVVGPELLEVTVSETPDPISITGKIFSFQPSLQDPDSIRYDHRLKKYSIYFPKNAIKNGEVYDLSVNRLADECGNSSAIGHYGFGYYIPVRGDLLISEILFNPFPGGVDFVEIYNKSGRKIEGSEIYLASLDTALKIKSISPLSDVAKQLLNGGYAAFTSERYTLLSNYHSDCEECIYEMRGFPPFNLDRGIVVLFNKEMGIIDEFHYIETMHDPLITDVKGISLERSSFSKPSEEILNWHSASETVGFATPGYRNSAIENSAETRDIVEIENKIFSPNDDGLNDRLLIRLSPGEPGWMVNIRIYNDMGLEIRRLANNVTIGSDDVIEWDGTMQNHSKASLGIYVIKVELFGLNFRSKQFKTACVITDRL